MATTPQELYNRIEETKAKIKEQKTMLIEMYENEKEYVEFTDGILKLKLQRNEITDRIQRENPDIVNKLDDLRRDLKSDKVMFTDMLVTSMMKEETVELQTKYEQMVFPIFQVKLQIAK